MAVLDVDGNENDAATNAEPGPHPGSLPCAKRPLLREMPALLSRRPSASQSQRRERATMRVKLPKPVAAIYKAVEELEARS